MLVRPMLLHRMALVSVRLFFKNLGKLQEFFGQMGYRPPPPPAKKLPIRLCKGLLINRSVCYKNKLVLLSLNAGGNKIHPPTHI